MSLSALVTYGLIITWICFKSFFPSRIFTSVSLADKRFAINTRLEYVDAIEQYKIKNNIASDSGIFNAAIMYCIKHNIDLTEK